MKSDYGKTIFELFRGRFSLYMNYHLTKAAEVVTHTGYHLRGNFLIIKNFGFGFFWRVKNDE